MNLMSLIPSFLGQQPGASLAQTSGNAKATGPTQGSGLPKMLTQAGNLLSPLVGGGSGLAQVAPILQGLFGQMEAQPEGSLGAPSSFSLRPNTIQPNTLPLTNPASLRRN